MPPVTRAIPHWVVVGSGFGGSVAALRLVEKGYDVTVVEVGRRFEDHDFARSAWNLPRYLWAPRLGWRGITRITTTRHVSIVSGVGVGGGSLAYANVLYRADPHVLAHPRWSGLADWAAELAPHYAEAERLLGATPYRAAEPGGPDDPGDLLLQDLGRDLGGEHTYRKASVGVFLGTPGRTVPDPLLDGAGPPRTGCTRCGDCLLGCRVGAKNTLVKNYLHLAEHRGAFIRPDTEVVGLRPRGAEDGRDGYLVTVRARRSWGRLGRAEVIEADGVVLAGGVLGTTRLLTTARAARDLPRLSERVGHEVRTNGEFVPGVLLPRVAAHGLTGRVAITSSIHPTPDTHVETLGYGAHADYMSTGLTLLTTGGRRRALAWLGTIARHPWRFAQTLVPFGQSRRQLMLLVMGTGGGALRLRPGPRGGLVSELDPDDPLPSTSAVAEDAARRLAARTGGIAESPLLDAVAGIGLTAHPLGGAVIGASPAEGVVDADQRVFGYRNLLVCDGSVVPVNLGTNPSLTITALAERAMSRVPAAQRSPGRADGVPVPLAGGPVQDRS